MAAAKGKVTVGSEIDVALRERLDKAHLKRDVPGPRLSLVPVAFIWNMRRSRRLRMCQN